MGLNVLSILIEDLHQLRIQDQYVLSSQKSCKKLHLKIRTLSVEHQELL